MARHEIEWSARLVAIENGVKALGLEGGMDTCDGKPRYVATGYSGEQGTITHYGYGSFDGLVRVSWDAPIADNRVGHIYRNVGLQYAPPNSTDKSGWIVSPQH